ncbi:transporter substrate-binding domain-containing protein [Psychrosphaera sp.]|nr:transporter substrate-binding domain-containing protein [Psychrosphaera sp.]
MDYYNNNSIRFLSPMKSLLFCILRITIFCSLILSSSSSAFVFVSAGAGAGAASTPSNQATLQFKTQKQPEYDVIKVAIDTETVPFSYFDKGKPTGYLIDLWELWAKKNNQKIEFVISDWANTIINVKNGVADVHSALAVNEFRVDNFDFGHEIYSAPIKVYVHKDLQMFSGLEELDPYLMGAVSEFNVEQFVLDKKPNTSIRTYKTWEDLLVGIYKSEIKTFVSYDFFTYRYEDYLRINDLFPAYKSITVGSVKTQLAVQKGNIRLLNRINAGFVEISDAERQQLYDKWFASSQKDDTLLLSLSVGAKPFMGIDADGTPVGLFVDLWKLWSNKTKTKIKFVPSTAELSMEALKEGATNVHIGYPESMAINSGLPRAKHIYSTKAHLFVYDQYDFEQPLEQLNGRAVGLYKDSPYQNEFESRYPEINVEYFDNLDEAINASIQGRIAGFVVAAQMARARLSENNIAERFHEVPDINFEAKVYSLVSSKDKALIRRINDGFDLISEQELVDIENRWIQDYKHRYFGTNKSEFNLSIEEKGWLEDNPEMSVAIVEDWKPYEFVDEEGEAAGISRDMFDLAKRLTGQNYSFKAYPTWDLLYQDFKDGNVDMVANITASEEREVFAYFTPAYWRTPWSVITHKSIDNVASIKKFYGKRLAIIQGYQIIKDIHDNHPQIIIQVVKDFDEAHDLLKAGVIDGILDLMSVSAQYIQDNSLYQFKIHVFEDLGSDNAHIGVKKTLPIQATIMNKVVDSMSKEDIENILKRWNKVDVVAGIKSEIYWRNITIFVGIASIIILIILIWNRRLKSEILLRQKAEQKLRHLASHDPMTGLPNRSLLIDRLKQAMSHHSRNNKNIAILFLDLDGFKEVNDTFGHDVGDELLTQISERLLSLSRNSDTVARFGGDEFVMLATNLNDGNYAAKVAEKIIADLSDPFVLSRATVSVGVSIGIAKFPQNGHDATVLIKAADDAMYAVKASGKNSYQFAGTNSISS